MILEYLNIKNIRSYENVNIELTNRNIPFGRSIMPAFKTRERKYY